MDRLGGHKVDRFRAVTTDKRVVYGMPSYGFMDYEVTEIGFPDGDFAKIIKGSLSEPTGFCDRTGMQIYTGDYVELELPSGVRRFEVKKKMIDRELVPPKGFTAEGKNVVRMNTFVFEYEGTYLLPCVDADGVCDTEKMRIVGSRNEDMAKAEE